MDGTLLSVSAAELYAHLGTASSPILVDVRGQDAFDADDRQIIGYPLAAPSWSTATMVVRSAKALRRRSATAASRRHISMGVSPLGRK